MIKWALAFDEIQEFPEIVTAFKFFAQDGRAGNKDYWGCVEWLEDAGGVEKCKAMDFPELPIGAHLQNLAGTDPDCSQSPLQQYCLA